jgi:hypothetical protein
VFKPNSGPEPLQRFIHEKTAEAYQQKLWPQMRCALSRGFAIGGGRFGFKPRAALADSLALGYKYAAPMGLHLAAAPDGI